MACQHGIKMDVFFMIQERDTYDYDQKQITRCITLHLLWTVRNDGLFRQRQPLPLEPALRIGYTIFSAHLRACMRRVHNQRPRASLQLVLAQLRRSCSMGTFIRANTSLFTLRFL
ncbi:hypothetical protein PsorP6_011937 [Peronosclerospora sorghi]|uniref:Uncharacterized protein n=1 Tax=Peronosclerospora sorghi TaxID=230839 RepID=A0ACC0WHL5_9STRA|nr:hypothetical protein PsorP6_011937 [Peronosclerospora sorghi]